MVTSNGLRIDDSSGTQGMWGVTTFDKDNSDDHTCPYPLQYI